MVLWVLSEEGREERGEGRRSEKGGKRMEWERGERRKGRKRGGEREEEREEKRRREKGRGKGGREEEGKGKGKGRKRGGGKREGEREEERRREKGGGKGRGEGRKKQVKGIFTMNMNATTDRHRHGSMRTETLHWYQRLPVSPVVMLELGLTTLPTVLTTVIKIS